MFYHIKKAYVGSTNTNDKLTATGAVGRNGTQSS